MQTEWACLLGSGWQRWSHASRWGLSESRLSCSLLNWSTYNSLTLTVTRVQGRMWSAPSRSRKPTERLCKRPPSCHRSRPQTKENSQESKGLGQQQAFQTSRLSERKGRRAAAERGARRRRCESTRPSAPCDTREWRAGCTWRRRKANRRAVWRAACTTTHAATPASWRYVRASLDGLSAALRCFQEQRGQLDVFTRI